MKVHILWRLFYIFYQICFLILSAYHYLLAYYYLNLCCPSKAKKTRFDDHGFFPRKKVIERNCTHLFCQQALHGHCSVHHDPDHQAEML
jgi:hypothetical protein